MPLPPGTQIPIEAPARPAGPQPSLTDRLVALLRQAPLAAAQGLAGSVYGVPGSTYGNLTRVALAGVRSALPGGGTYDDERQRIAAADDRAHPGIASVIPEVRNPAIQKATAEDMAASAMMLGAVKVPAYHGGPAGLTLIDPALVSKRHWPWLDKKMMAPPSAKGAAFFSTNPEVANTYRLAATGEYGHLPASLYKAEVAMENPLIVDAGGARWQDVIPDTLSTATRPSAGYDGAVVKNVSDSALKRFADLRGDTVIPTHFSQIGALSEISSAEEIRALIQALRTAPK